MSKLQMKQFMYKHVIREKSLRERATTNEKYVIATSLFILIQLFVYVQIQNEYEKMYKWRDEQIADTCRIKHMIYDYDTKSKTYACKLKSNGDLILIHETESPKLLHNGYIERPVKIYKNGNVE
jgi:hypothetical protein